MPKTFSESAALKLLMELIPIPGKSCEEAEIAQRIIKKAKAAGVPDAAIKIDSAHKKSPYGGDCGNLIIKLKGTVKAPRRLLMAHIDTVPLCVGARPVRDGAIIRPKDSNTALGGDDRAGTTVLLSTLLTILKQKLQHPPLTFFWPVQEEIGLVGVKHVSVRDLGTPKLCFNWDGHSAAGITIGATGAFNIKIDVHGIAAHAGMHPELGIPAMGIASVAIADLIENGWHGLVEQGSKRGTCNLGIINGGDATNVVNDRCTIWGEVRSHDEKFRQRILKEIEKAFQRAAKKLKSADGKTGSFDFDWDVKYPAFLISKKEACVQAAKQAVEKTDLEPHFIVANGGLDANYLSDHGFPTVTLGCGETNVHTTSEHVVIEDFLNACRIALHLATDTES